MLNNELPVWVARIVGLSLFVVGVLLASNGGGGLLLGGLLAVVGISIGLTRPKAPRRKCPYCAELVKREARVCKHCHRELARKPAGNGGESDHEGTNPFEF